MTRFMRFRYLVFVPFLVLLFGTWLGGYFLNTTEAHGIVVDSSTGQPVKDVDVAFGQRKDVTDENGAYDLVDLPRGARISISPRFSYADQSVDTDATKVELVPTTLSLTVIEKNVVPDQPVKSAEVRQNDKLLASGTDTGAVVIAPYPQVGSKILVCAPDHQSTEVEARGTQLTVGLVSGGTGCPPLPSPSPSGSPSASPGASGSPAPAPSPSPTPTSTP